MNNTKKKSALLVIIAVITLLVLTNAPFAASADNRIQVEKPTLDVELVYNGESQTVSLPDSEYYSSRAVSHVNAGTYYISVSLKDKNKYVWEDGTTNDLRLEFQIKPATFDQSQLVYSDETFVYDSKDHLIDIKGLPKTAHVVFNTHKSEPGIYNCKAEIDLGANYLNRYITLEGATLTILATEIKCNVGSFVIREGVNPNVKLDLRINGNKTNFSSSVGVGEELYIACAPELTLEGEIFKPEDGSYEYKIFVPSKEAKIKVLVSENGKIKEVPYVNNGRMVTFEVRNTDEFAIVYTGLSASEAPSMLWLEILLGVIVVGEAVAIVLQALKLKKLK